LSCCPLAEDLTKGPTMAGVVMVASSDLVCCASPR
jgi:hypothetical protein